MPSLTVLTKVAGDLLLFLVTVADIGSLFNTDNLREEVLKHEKLRRDAVSRYIRKTGRNPMHKDTEQRPTVLPRTRRILPVQNGEYAEGEHSYARPRKHPGKHVCNEPSTVRPRKRILDSDNGG